MKKRYYIFFYFILLFFISALSHAADYTWKGSTGILGNSWITQTNWNPSTGYPKNSSDKAIFNSSSAVNCAVVQNVSIGELYVDTDYAGTLAITAFELKPDNATIKGGTITGVSADKFIVKNNLNVSGGSLITLDATCEGNAEITAGTIGILRFKGANSNLTGAESTVLALGSLVIDSGNCIVKNSFIAGTLTVNSGTSLRISNKSTLTTTTNKIDGTLYLDSTSAMVFSTNANITGNIDSSTSGSMVVCNGNWNMSGTYTPSGNGTSILTIIQTANGENINHGNNAADIVIVRNGEGKKSVWQSTNEIFELTVGNKSTLEIPASSILSVKNIILNGGKIIETSPGHIHHPADSLRALSETGVVVPEIPVGASFKVNLVDQDELLDFEAIDIAQGVKIVNPRNSDELNLSAIETGVNTTLLMTNLIATENTDAAVNDDKMQVLDGDVLQITYIDNEDAADNQAAAELRIGTSVLPTPTFFPTPVPIQKDDIIDHILGIKLIGPVRFLEADSNKDGIIDIVDLILFLK